MRLRGLIDDDHRIRVPLMKQWLIRRLAEEE